MKHNTTATAPPPASTRAESGWSAKVATLLSRSRKEATTSVLRSSLPMPFENASSISCMDFLGALLRSPLQMGNGPAEACESAEAVASSEISMILGPQSSALCTAASKPLVTTNNHTKTGIIHIGGGSASPNPSASATTAAEYARTGRSRNHLKIPVVGAVPKASNLPIFRTVCFTEVFFSTDRTDGWDSSGDASADVEVDASTAPSRRLRR
mmetsp:Transcript_42774/g.93352  ORF Transcript_42774/g.93352 Transcript_42774/m.93352 type:complete len:212 (-) Transcript_42774:570-1205(-)